VIHCVSTIQIIRRGECMKHYELKLENSLGRKLIATFYDAEILKKYVNDNPPLEKYNYYVLVEETTMTRVNDISKVM